MAAALAAASPIGPEWDRLAARSRAALVRQERLALSSLRAAVKAATGPALLALSRLPTAEPRATADAGIALLRAAVPRLAKGFAAALAKRRADTKGAAVGRMADEWRAVRAAVRARGYADPGALTAVGAALTHTDHAAVESTAGSYAAAWQSATADALWTWAAAPEDGQGPADAAAAAAGVEGKAACVVGLGVPTPSWAEAAEAGAQCLVALNASPFHHDKIDARQQVARYRVEETGLPLAYVNLTGGQDELVFDGGSFVVDAVNSPPPAPQAPSPDQSVPPPSPARYHLDGYAPWSRHARPLPAARPSRLRQRTRCRAV